MTIVLVFYSGIILGGCEEGYAENDWFGKKKVVPRRGY